MSRRGNKRTYEESEMEMDNLQNKYERIWDELDIAFIDISKMKNDLVVTKERVNNFEETLIKFKKETEHDIDVNHTNINYVSMRLIAVILIWVIYWNLF